MLIHTCDIWRRSSGTADFGNPSGVYAALYEGVACRRHERVSPAHDFPGEVVESSSLFWFMPGTDIKLQDQIVFGGARFEVEKVVEDVAGVGEVMRVTCMRQEVT